MNAERNSASIVTQTASMAREAVASTQEYFQRNVRQLTLLVGIGAPAVFGAVACGGGSDNGRTFVSTDATQTAQAPDATPTAERPKVVVIEITSTPTATPKPTEVPTATPTPEKVYTPAEVTSAVNKAVNASTNVAASQKEFITGSTELAIQKMGGTDAVSIRTVYGNLADAGAALLKVACTNPANADAANAFLAVKALETKYLDDKIAAGLVQKSVKDTIMAFQLKVYADCANPVLVPPTE